MKLIHLALGLAVAMKACHGFTGIISPVKSTKRLNRLHTTLPDTENSGEDLERDFGLNFNRRADDGDVLINTFSEEGDEQPNVILGEEDAVFDEITSSQQQNSEESRDGLLDKLIQYVSSSTTSSSVSSSVIGAEDGRDSGDFAAKCILAKVGSIPDFIEVLTAPGGQPLKQRYRDLAKVFHPDAAINTGLPVALTSSLMSNLTGAFKYLTGEVGLSSEGELVSVSSPWGQTYSSTGTTGSTSSSSVGGTSTDDAALDVAEVVEFRDDDSAAVATHPAAVAAVAKKTFTKPSTAAASANVEPAIRLNSRVPPSSASFPAAAAAAATTSTATTAATTTAATTAATIATTSTATTSTATATTAIGGATAAAADTIPAMTTADEDYVDDHELLVLGASTSVTAAAAAYESTKNKKLTGAEKNDDGTTIIPDEEDGEGKKEEEEEKEEDGEGKKEMHQVYEMWRNWGKDIRWGEMRVGGSDLYVDVQTKLAKTNHQLGQPYTTTHSTPSVVDGSASQPASTIYQEAQKKYAQAHRRKAASPTADVAAYVASAEAAAAAASSSSSHRSKSSSSSTAAAGGGGVGGGYSATPSEAYRKVAPVVGAVGSSYKIPALSNFQEEEREVEASRLTANFKFQQEAEEEEEEGGKQPKESSLSASSSSDISLSMKATTAANLAAAAAILDASKRATAAAAAASNGTEITGSRRYPHKWDPDWKDPIAVAAAAAAVGVPMKPSTASAWRSALPASPASLSSPSSTDSSTTTTIPAAQNKVTPSSSTYSYSTSSSSAASDIYASSAKSIAYASRAAASSSAKKYPHKWEPGYVPLEDRGKLAVSQWSVRSPTKSSSPSSSSPSSSTTAGTTSTSTSTVSVVPNPLVRPYNTDKSPIEALKRATAGLDALRAEKELERASVFPSREDASTLYSPTTPSTQPYVPTVAKPVSPAMAAKRAAVAAAAAERVAYVDNILDQMKRPTVAAKIASAKPVPRSDIDIINNAGSSSTFSSSPASSSVLGILSKAAAAIDSVLNKNKGSEATSVDATGRIASRVPDSVWIEGALERIRQGEETTTTMPKPLLDTSSSSSSSGARLMSPAAAKWVDLAMNKGAAATTASAQPDYIDSSLLTALIPSSSASSSTSSSSTASSATARMPLSQISSYESVIAAMATPASDKPEDRIAWVESVLNRAKDSGGGGGGGGAESGSAYNNNKKPTLQSEAVPSKSKSVRPTPSSFVNSALLSSPILSTPLPPRATPAAPSSLSVAPATQSNEVVAATDRSKSFDTAPGNRIADVRASADSSSLSASPIPGSKTSLSPFPATAGGGGGGGGGGGATAGAVEEATENVAWVDSIMRRAKAADVKRRTSDVRNRAGGAAAGSGGGGGMASYVVRARSDDNN